MTLNTTWKYLVALLVVLVATGTIVGAERGDRAPTPDLMRPSPPADNVVNAPTPTPRTGIVNKVIDLLDGELLLASDGPNTIWESPTFDTSQYNRIGLKVEGEMVTGSISCSTAWQFTADDTFRESFPSDSVRVQTPAGIRPGRPDLFIVPSGLSSVNGLRAKIVCSPTAGTFGAIGDDASLVVAQSEGKLHNVLVLLRRE